MIKGGYAIIDCKGLNLLSETSQTIAGLFDKVNTAYKRNKLIHAVNVKWGTTPMSPIPIFVNDLDGVLVCTASTLQIRISNDDSVTIVNMAPSANRATTAKSSK